MGRGRSSNWSNNVFISRRAAKTQREHLSPRMNTDLHGSRTGLVRPLRHFVDLWPANIFLRTRRRAFITQRRQGAKNVLFWTGSTGFTGFSAVAVYERRVNSHALTLSTALTQVRKVAFTTELRADVDVVSWGLSKNNHGRLFKIHSAWHRTPRPPSTPLL